MALQKLSGRLSFDAQLFEVAFCCQNSFAEVLRGKPALCCVAVAGAVPKSSSFAHLCDM